MAIQCLGIIGVCGQGLFGGNAELLYFLLGQVDRAGHLPPLIQRVVRGNALLLHLVGPVLGFGDFIDGLDFLLQRGHLRVVGIHRAFVALALRKCELGFLVIQGRLQHLRRVISANRFEVVPESGYAFSNCLPALLQNSKL